MIERNKKGYFMSHLGLIIGIVFIFFPVWLTFVASTVTQEDIIQPPFPLLPGPHFLKIILMHYLKELQKVMEKTFLLLNY